MKCVQVSYNDLVQRNLSLVIAIWDQDTHSKDDYMAGVGRDIFLDLFLLRFHFQFRAKFPPTPIPSFGKEAIVNLKHQDRDGHVSKNGIVFRLMMMMTF